MSAPTVRVAFGVVGPSEDVAATLEYLGYSPLGDLPFSEAELEEVYEAVGRDDIVVIDVRTHLEADPEGDREIARIEEELESGSLRLYNLPHDAFSERGGDIPEAEYERWDALVGSREAYEWTLGL